MDKSNDWPSVPKNCGSKKRLSRRRLCLADKTRELNARKTWTDATRFAENALRGLLEPVERKSYEAQKEALRSPRRGESGSQRDKPNAEEEAVLVASKQRQSCSHDGAGIVKIPPINKMMIIGQRSKRPKTVATEDVLDAMTHMGLRSQEKLLSSLEDEQAATGQIPELLQAVTMLREDDLDEAKDIRDQRRAEDA